MASRAVGADGTLSGLSEISDEKAGDPAVGGHNVSTSGKRCVAESDGQQGTSIEGRQVKNDRPPKADDRAPMAKAVDVASRILSASAGVALLGVGGHFIDKRLGWNGPMLVVGVLLGFVVFLWQLVKLVKDESSKP